MALQRSTGGGGGSYADSDPWTEDDSDSTDSTLSLPDGIQDSGPAGNEDTGGFGGGTGEVGGTDDSDQMDGVPGFGGGSDDTDPEPEPDPEPETQPDPEPQIPDEIQNPGSSTGNNQSGMGPGTGRSGQTPGEVADDEEAEVEVPGPNPDEPVTSRDNSPSNDESSDDQQEGIGTAGKVGAALLVGALVVGGR